MGNNKSTQAKQQTLDYSKIDLDNLKKERIDLFTQIGEEAVENYLKHQKSLQPQDDLSASIVLTEKRSFNGVEYLPGIRLANVTMLDNFKHDDLSKAIQGKQVKVVGFEE